MSVVTAPSTARGVRGLLRRGIRTAARAGRSRRALAGGFVLLHLAFLAALLPVMLAGGVLGDLPLYREWALGAVHGGLWPGVNGTWVYPVGALPLVVLPVLFGPDAYQLVWFLLVTAANAGAVLVLTDRLRDRRALPAAWAYLGFLLLLSPVALLRLESFTTPIVLVALVLIAARPVLASALLAVAAWIKVWPAGVLAAAVLASARRWLIAASALVTAGAIVGVVIALGGMRHVLSFLLLQDGRGLQLEAPLATPWVWMSILHVHTAHVYQDWRLATREVTGPGDGIAIALSGVLMAVAVATVALLVMRARRADADPHRLLLTGALAMVTALIVFNKVGSPQYMLWLVPIVVAGIAHDSRAWRTPALLLALVSVATTLVFPTFYLALIQGDPVISAVLGVRNVLLVVLLGWACARLWRLGNAGQERRDAVTVKVRSRAI